MSENHKVRRGDDMRTIASERGFKDWRVLYEHADNAQLRAARPDPGILDPGDVVKLPEEAKLRTNRRYRRTISTHKPLRLRLLDREERPVANQSCTIEARTKKPFLGKTVHTQSAKTDAQGLLKVKVPIPSREATITVGGLTFELRIGWLSHVHSNEAGETSKSEGARGAEDRLDNLGYVVTQRRHAKLKGATAGALIEFQADQGLDTTQRLDDATRAKLLEEHGS